MSSFSRQSIKETETIIDHIPINDDNRFSRFIKSRKSEDYQDLVTWQQWFASRGIASVIHGNSSGYALYRQGLIKIELHNDED